MVKFRIKQCNFLKCDLENTFKTYSEYCFLKEEEYSDIYS